MSDELNDKIRDLLSEGKKIAAVKLVRERQKCSLREAVNTVELIESGNEVSISDPAPASDGEMDAVLDAIEKGEKLRAVKLYRESTGADLRESKEFVESLTRQLGGSATTSTQTGCFSSILLFVGMGGGVITGLVALWVAV
ncbi:hypothetical protein LOC67_22510 [Stieleria sp. JC731]|uniref:hypothetical protein n=1 Tax=Pirellulaceae TaxID=2691357 RepID=UPI001E31BCCA|nr:hypothetical protein [Stieleria sp. JC731]MCC9603332.1 hypothetical protein [Stieleria sp. JC731]